MQPFLQFLVDFGSCDMDECYNEQQQLQYGSNASVWNKFVACKQAKYEACNLCLYYLAEGKIQILQAYNAV